MGFGAFLIVNLSLVRKTVLKETSAASLSENYVVLIGAKICHIYCYLTAFSILDSRPRFIMPLLL